MARIQLRDTRIYIQDGLAGSGEVDEMSPTTGMTSIGVAGVSLNTDVTNQVPIGARFTIDGEPGSPVHTVTGRTPTSGATTEITFIPGLSASVPPVVGVQAVVDVDVTADSGTFTLTINGDTTAAIAYNVTSEDFETALTNAGHPADVTGSAGDYTITFDDEEPKTVSGNGANLVGVGAEVVVTPVTPGVTPVAGSGVENDAVITFLPQRIEIKIGEGDLSWTESRELIYDLDRDQLDTVRLGQEQPVQVDLAFTFEYVTTQSGQAITPVDAIKRLGEASEWVSSSSDLCEPYAVDLYVIHDVPCGTDHDQSFLFPDFRYDELDYSIQDASITVSGQCNTTDVISVRAAEIL